ncbi:MAG TPA: Ig-like domain-containing protein [Burkholderiales bacterium]|nr:Ig-like domain-containing protein [Burkholderiales bacterium]
MTAIVLDANRQAISGQTVTFSPGTDPSAFVNNVSASGVSDANGIVTAQLNLGSSKANRTIDVKATTGAISATNSVDVTGTTISVSGNSSLAFNAFTTLTFSVKDSAGNAVPGATVTVTSQTGNTLVLSPTTGVTDSAGQITATVKADQPGNDTITASASGASTTQALTISPDTFGFAPLANTDIPLGTAQPVSINWTKNGTAQAGKAVTFSISRGAVSGSPATTNAAGTAGVTVSSPNTAGPAIITAAGPGGTPAATLNVTFVSTTASSATAQAVPGVVAFTSGSASQTNNSSTISVVVRDASNNLVKNAAVTFSITADPSNGRLTSSNGITDVSGSTSVTYIAGGTSSPANGVKILATVTAVNGVALGAPVTATTSLTVAGQASLVRLGTDNLVGGTAPSNSKTFIATVTDTAGNPVVGATVRFSLLPGRFRKGVYAIDTVNSVWVQVVKATCPNEDVNFNGIVDTGEDINGNGRLDPGGVATVNATGTTDANGNAVATVTYAKDHSTWAEMTLQAQTGVVGNDPPTTTTFFLPGLAADYTSINVAPPGQTSPYGAGASTSCADTN